MCAQVLRSRKTGKKKEMLGTSNNESKFTEKKLLVSTRTPEDVTVSCIRRAAIKATTSFFVSVSLPVRVKHIVFQRTDFCEILYTEKF